jgi:hypothetical protein
MAKEKEKSNANIAFVGEGKPLVSINAQGVSIKLPEDQSKPFYHERAKFIIQNFPHLYKPARPLGDK